MTPPTGGGAASCERAGASEIATTKIAMTRSVLMKPDRDMSGKLSCFLPTTLTFPAERGESVWTPPTSAATSETAGRKTKRHRFRDAVGIRGVRQAAQNVCFRAIVKRSRRWRPAFHPDPSPQSQERNKKETRKKKGRRNAGRRVVHDPRFGAARADRSALACRRSTTALAAANERRSSTPATRFL
jgi:hypothetical protein